MKLQIIYADACFEPSTPQHHNGWLDEIAAMRAIGLPVAAKPSPQAERLLLRSNIIHRESDFPTDPRYLSHWADYSATRNITSYLPLIADLTIPTFITHTLDAGTEAEIRRRGWQRAFVRSNEKSLKFHFPESHTLEDLPVWPQVSMEQLAQEYGKVADQMRPPYVVRQYMPPEVMDQEDRYWVMNGHPHHRSGVIPPVVQEAVKRLATLGAKYYVIDATPQFIVELNPGVSSDAYPDNIPAHFPHWVQQEFG